MKHHLEADDIHELAIGSRGARQGNTLLGIYLLVQVVGLVVYILNGPSLVGRH